jgi:hypothetical protein
MQIHNSVTDVADQQTSTLNNSLTVVYVYPQYVESDNRWISVRFLSFSEGKEWISVSNTSRRIFCEQFMAILISHFT